MISIFLIPGIFVLFGIFWLKLNMFVTLRYLIGLGIITFLAGNKLLSHIAKAHKASRWWLWTKTEIQRPNVRRMLYIRMLTNNVFPRCSFCPCLLHFFTSPFDRAELSASNLIVMLRAWVIVRTFFFHRERINCFDSEQHYFVFVQTFE